jgi:carbon storage regulator
MRPLATSSSNRVKEPITARKERRGQIMLVLSRKVGQSIVIDGNVIITVNRVGGKRITLGIEAPNNVRVLRGELRPFGENASGQEDTAASTGSSIEIDVDECEVEAEEEEITRFVIRAAQLPHSQMSSGYRTA